MGRRSRNRGGAARGGGGGGGGGGGDRGGGSGGGSSSGSGGAPQGASNEASKEGGNGAANRGVTNGGASNGGSDDRGASRNKAESPIPGPSTSLNYVSQGAADDLSNLENFSARAAEVAAKIAGKLIDELTAECGDGGMVHDGTRKLTDFQTFDEDYETPSESQGEDDDDDLKDEEQENGEGHRTFNNHDQEYGKFDDNEEADDLISTGENTKTVPIHDIDDFTFSSEMLEDIAMANSLYISLKNVVRPIQLLRIHSCIGQRMEYNETKRVVANLRKADLSGEDRLEAINEVIRRQPHLVLRKPKSHKHCIPVGDVYFGYSGPMVYTMVERVDVMIKEVLLGNK